MYIYGEILICFLGLSQGELASAMQMLPYLLALIIFKSIALFTVTCMFRQ